MSGHALGLVAEAFCVVLAGITGFHALRRRRSAPTVACWLVLLMGGIVFWSLGGLLLRGADHQWVRVAGVMVFSLAVPVLVTGYLMLSRSLVDSSDRPARRDLWTLLEPATLLWCLVQPGPRHAFIGTVPETVTGAGALLWRPGPLFWAHVVYCIVVFTAAVVVQLRGLAHAASSHQAQLASNFVSAVVPVLGCLALAQSVLTEGGFHHGGQVDWPAAGFILTCLINLWALHSQGLLTVLPVARGLVLQELSDAVFIFDAAGHLVDRNSEAEDLLARCGRRIARVTTDTRLDDVLGFLGGDVRPENGEYLVATHPPREVDLRLRDICAAGRRYGTALVVRDITGINRSRREVVLANEALRTQVATIEALQLELQDQAYRDVLTGVHNRRRFEQVLAETYADARAHAVPFSLAVVDIDHFKAVNDRYGHLAGDDVLTVVARALADETTACEQVFRFGGEEFVVILPGVGRAGAASRGWDFAARTTLPDAGGISGLNLTTSIGVASYPDDGHDAMAVLQAADTALYRAKDLGRARVEAARPMRLVAVPDLPPGGSQSHRTA